MPDIADPCLDLVRKSDRDRFIATLFAPADQRDALFALYAFNIEIARVRDVVREPLPGEIRLQWWREVIESDRRGEAASHPIASRLLAALDANRLPPAAFTGLIEARIFDLYNDPMPSLSYLEGYCGETSSAIVRLASIILNDGENPGAADAAGYAGVALGMTSILKNLPLHSRRGQCYLPVDLLTRHGTTPDAVLNGSAGASLSNAVAEMAGHIRMHRDKALSDPATRGRLAPAFLPLALIEGDLKRILATGDLAAPIAFAPAWRRQLTLWMAARR